MLGSYPSFLPMLFATPNPQTERARVLNDSVYSYYGWNNAKKRLALDVAMSGFGSDRDTFAGSLGNAVVAYSALSVGEKLVRWYQGKLDNWAERSPRFEDFRNSRPVVAAILTWIPGIALALAGGGLAALAGHAVLLRQPIQAFLKHPVVQKLAGMGVLAGLALTGFIGILGRNAVGAASDYGREYRSLRQKYPELAPQELKALLTTARNDRAALFAQENEKPRMLSRRIDTRGFAI